MNSSSDDTDKYNGDAGPPLPNFNSSGINIGTVAPALGLNAAALGAPPLARNSQADYIEYEQGGRGLHITMFSNAGLSYLIGGSVGSIYGFKEGLAKAPSSRFRVRLNALLNSCGKNGGRMANRLGSLSVIYTLYEGLGDNYEFERYTGLPMTVPGFAAFMTGLTYKSLAGPKVATLAGTIGLGAVGVTYATYNALGIPYGYRNFLFF